MGELAKASGKTYAQAMEILGFLGAVSRFALDPVALGAGLGIGYLFHADFAKLAWMLLLFVVPGIGSMGTPDSRHGAIYAAVAEFIAVCAITALTYWCLEFLRTRRRR